MLSKRAKFSRETEILDWSYNKLNKKVFSLLKPGCTVRVAYYRSTDNQWCRDYVKILKIKDGTLWGEVLDYYRIGPDEWETFEEGQTISFRYNNITEIPVSWQPNKIRKKMNKYHHLRPKQDATKDAFVCLYGYTSSDGKPNLFPV